MKIWLLKASEPFPIPGHEQERVFRMGYLAQTCVARGHQVTWFGSTFHHHRKIQLFPQDTTIQIAPRFKTVLLHGCDYHNNISFARIRNHRQIARKFMRLALQETEPPEVILAALPTIEFSYESVRYGRLHNIPVVLDLRDMWPDIMVHSLPWLLRPLGRLCLEPSFRQTRFALERATAITGITEAFVDWGLRHGRRVRTDLDRAFYLGFFPNQNSEATLQPAGQYWTERLGPVDRQPFTACFLGGLVRKTAGLEAVIKAARQLHHQGCKFRLVIAGDGDRRCQLEASARDLPEVFFPGWIGSDQMQVLMKRSSVGLNPMLDRYDYLASINNKAIEYLSAGLPLITSPRQGVIFSDLIVRHQCGEAYPRDDAGELAQILLNFSRNPTPLRQYSINCLRLFNQEFTGEKVYTQMAEHLECVARRSAQRPLHQTLPP
jgi:glycosyltransferase involved in cell wall biosynthesis